MRNYPFKSKHIIWLYHNEIPMFKFHLATRSLYYTNTGKSVMRRQITMTAKHYLDFEVCAIKGNRILKEVRNGI